MTGTIWFSSCDKKYHKEARDLSKAFKSNPAKNIRVWSPGGGNGWSKKYFRWYAEM